MLLNFPLQIAYKPLIVAMILSGGLFSCAAQKQVDESSAPTEQSKPREMIIWSKSKPSGSAAVKSLLNKVDQLLEQKAYSQAEAKAERIVKIAPTFAPVWSRLAWLALQNSLYERSQQFAQRSNSYAGKDKSLKRLNWAMIVQANVYVKNKKLAKKAQQWFQSKGKVE